MKSCFCCCLMPVIYNRHLHLLTLILTLIVYISSCLLLVHTGKASRAVFPAVAILVILLEMISWYIRPYLFKECGPCQWIPIFVETIADVICMGIVYMKSFPTELNYSPGRTSENQQLLDVLLVITHYVLYISLAVAALKFLMLSSWIAFVLPFEEKDLRKNISDVYNGQSPCVCTFVNLKIRCKCSQKQTDESASLVEEE